MAARGKTKRQREDLEASNAFAMHLWRLAQKQSTDRKYIENIWLEDTLQYYGRYTEEEKKDFSGRSTIYINQTRPKCITLIARIADILFPTGGERNWDLKPTPLPELKAQANREEPDPKQAPSPLEAAEVAREGKQIQEARALRDQAQEHALAMRDLIADQLEECDYASLAVKAISQGVRLGAGVLKGPYADWRKDAAKMQPAFEWVDIWNFYPDMQATCMEDAEFVFEVHRMTRKELRQLGRKPGFSTSSLDYLLKRRDGEFGEESNSEFSNFTRYLYEISGNGLITANEEKFEVFEYHGPVPRRTLPAIARAYGNGKIQELFDSPESSSIPVRDACVWFCQDRILKFDLNPLDSEELPYSVFSLDENNVTMFGAGLPRKQRDSQAAFTSVWRAIIDNIGMAGLGMFIIDDRQVAPQGGGRPEIKPGKVWRRQSQFFENPPIEVIQIDGQIEKLLATAAAMQAFMDDETSIPLVAQGDPGTQVKQTAHGMNLLSTAVNIVFRYIARNWDTGVTLPSIRRIYQWNMQFSEDESVKGDLKVSARGSSHLLIKETQAQSLMMLLNISSSNPLLQGTFRIHEICRKLVEAMNLESDEVVVSEEEAEAFQKQQQEAAANEPNPEQTKLEIEQLRAQTEMKLLEANAQVNLAEAQIKAGVDIKKAMANAILEVQKMKQDRELFMAEAAIKAREGTGI